MAQLTDVEMANWVALYVAAGLCCGLALLLSVGILAVELCREWAWNQFYGLRDVILFLPRTWWRWQKLYLLSTPVTLVIVTAFAMTMSWR